MNIQTPDPACTAYIDENGFVTIITPSGEELPKVIKASIETDYKNTPIATVQLRVKTKSQEVRVSGDDLRNIIDKGLKGLAEGGEVGWKCPNCGTLHFNIDYATGRHYCHDCEYYFDEL